MADDIRSLSETLAVDPSSAVFVPLAELLRQRGDLDFAFRVATRGLQRHPQLVDAHDLVARISVDRGDEARARSEWERVLTLSPGHPGAQKGLGFLSYRQGDLESASRYLSAALAADPHDSALASALATVRIGSAAAARAAQHDRPTRVTTPPVVPMESSAPPSAPRTPEARELFADLLGAAAQTVLLLDRDGYVVAGRELPGPRDDRSAHVGAQLSGVSEEADRTMRHLALGRWRLIVFEAESASVAMAPAGDGVLLLAAPRAVPLGLVRRMLERSLERATRWLENGT